MSDTPVPAVTHDPAASRFEIGTTSGPAVLEYVRSGDTLDLVHTRVPPDFEGRGYGTALVEAAVAHATQTNLRIIPTCPFVRDFFDKHPEHAALRAARQ